VEQLADQLAARVNRPLAETGADMVRLIGHSLGGIVIARAFADGRLDGPVDTVVTSRADVQNVTVDDVGHVECC